MKIAWSDRVEECAFFYVVSFFSVAPDQMDVVWDNDVCPHALRGLVRAHHVLLLQQQTFPRTKVWPGHLYCPMYFEK